MSSKDKHIRVEGSVVNCTLCWSRGGKRLLPKRIPGTPSAANRVAVPYRAPSPEAAHQIAEHHRLSVGHNLAVGMASPVS